MSNRESVTLGLWPLPFVAVIPLYLVAFAGFLAGLAAGELHARLGRLRLKRALRRCEREAEALRRALATRPAPPEAAARESPPMPVQ